MFDNPNTTKTPDFSIGLGLDATLVLQGEAIEVIPYFVKKAGATALDNQEVKGYFKEGTALVEIPASEVYTGTRYDKDGNVDENGKFRKNVFRGRRKITTLSVSTIYSRKYPKPSAMKRFISRWNSG